MNYRSEFPVHIAKTIYNICNKRVTDVKDYNGSTIFYIDKLTPKERVHFVRSINKTYGNTTSLHKNPKFSTGPGLVFFDLGNRKVYFNSSKKLVKNKDSIKAEKKFSNTISKYIALSKNPLRINFVDKDTDTIKTFTNIVSCVHVGEKNNEYDVVLVNTEGNKCNISLKADFKFMQYRGIDQHIKPHAYRLCQELEKIGYISEGRLVDTCAIRLNEKQAENLLFNMLQVDVLLIMPQKTKVHFNEDTSTLTVLCECVVTNVDDIPSGIWPNISLRREQGRKAIPGYDGLRFCVYPRNAIGNKTIYVRTEWTDGLFMDIPKKPVDKEATLL